MGKKIRVDIEGWEENILGFDSYSWVIKGRNFIDLIEHLETTIFINFEETELISNFTAVWVYLER